MSVSCRIRRSRTSCFLKWTTSWSIELRRDLSSRDRSSAELEMVEAESDMSPFALLLNWFRVAVLYAAERAAVRRGRLSIERGLSEPPVPVPP